MFWKAPFSWKWSRKGKKEFSWQFPASRDQSRVIPLESEASRCACLGQPADRRNTCITLPRHVQGGILTLGCILALPGEVLKLRMLWLPIRSMKSEGREGCLWGAAGSSYSYTWTRFQRAPQAGVGLSEGLSEGLPEPGAAYHIPRRLTGSSNRTQAERFPIWSLFLNRLVPREAG